MYRATAPLPQPVSPVSSTVDSVRAARRARSMTLRIDGLRATICPDSAIGSDVFRRIPAPCGVSVARQLSFAVSCPASSRQSIFPLDFVVQLANVCDTSSAPPSRIRSVNGGGELNAGGTSNEAFASTRPSADPGAFSARIFTLAIVTVSLGGLTAKYPGAAVACTTIPACGANPNVTPAGVAVQIAHRTLALFLLLHLIGVVSMVRKRRDGEAPVVVRAAHIALALVMVQLALASSMILLHLPPVLRSLHEATGVAIWLSCFTFAYLAHRASPDESFAAFSGSRTSARAGSPAAES